MPLVRPPRIGPWKRTCTTVVGDYRVFVVEQHGLEDPSGKPCRDVHTFRCPDWCNVLAVTPSDELVLVWQYRHGTGTMSLELPGGLVEPGEDPASAALRELREESGYEAGSASLLSRVEPNPALQGNVLHSYLARDVRPTGAQEFDELEELEVALVPVRDAPRLIDEGHVRHALSITAIEAFLRRHVR